ncbi:MAG: MBL fold metallo-hydrolase [Firmicutes bacterium]|jgi:ribonuclease BN (tRNA processing enzyme)|nr:MBL fold metallo-hydrolase [Bacillota bacterium]
MDLRIIGRSSPYAGPGEAAVGYVVDNEGGHMMLECGTGVVAKYLQRYKLSELQGVIISHLHPDHSADLFPLGFAILHSLQQGLRSRPVHLYLPPGGVDTFNAVLEHLGGLQKHYAQAFAYREYRAHVPISIGNWKAYFHRVYHGMSCHGVMVEGEQGQRLGYTADTKMGPELERFFQGVDLLLCEATVDSEEEAQSTNHLTAEEAGRLGAAIGASHLVLTHFLPGTDVDMKKCLAARHFSGKITAAEIDAVYAVGGE